MDDNDYKNKKSQAPSYCDRVLFKNNSAHESQVMFYKCNDMLFGSDHRPVYMGITLKQQIEA